MIVSLALIGYVFIAARLGAGSLRRAEWTARAPRLAIALWACLIGSMVCAVLFAGVAPAIPFLGMAALPGGLPGLVVWLWHGGDHVGEGRVVLAGLAVSAALAGWMVFRFATAVWRTRKERIRHEELVRVLGRPVVVAGTPVTLIDHTEAAAYCLPGRNPRIVLTTEAARILNGPQLRAVLAHERAHLRGRHQLLTTLALATAALLPRSRTLATARLEVHRLVELLADDAAARATARLDLADAMLTLASAPVREPLVRRPAGIALASSDHSPAQRVRRLLDPRRPLGARAAVLPVLVALATALAPLALLLGPAVVALHPAYCTSADVLVHLALNGPPPGPPAFRHG